MGMKQQFRSDASWAQAVRLLDSRFPLADGSHAAAADYLVHHDHLLVIRTDGSCTGLSLPGQLVDVGGDECAPSSVVLERDGLQVEIEPERRRAATPETGGHAARRHRMQLITAISLD